MDPSPSKLNRFMYKTAPDVSADTPAYMSSTNSSPRNAQALNSSDPNNSKKDAKEIITGTVITACLIKSSDQDDRIEIGQNLDNVINNADVGDLDFRSIKALDYLVAYRPGTRRLALIITGLGMVYVGYGMPAAKVMHWDQAAGLLYNSPSEVRWAITVLGTGLYKITHHLNSLDYSPNVICSTSGGLGVYVLAYITDRGLNSFVINTFNLIGNPVDTDFECTVSIY